MSDRLMEGVWPTPRKCQQETARKYLDQNKRAEQYLQLQLLDDLHLHPTLSRAPVVQGVLIVEMPEKHKKRIQTYND